MSTSELFEAIDRLVQTFACAVNDSSLPLLVHDIREECVADGVDPIACCAMLDILQLWDDSKDMTVDFKALSEKMDRALFLSVCNTMENAVTNIVDTYESHADPDLYDE
jgi:aspartate carbamoyltransferase regulatory subunit